MPSCGRSVSVRPGLKALTRTPFACVGSGELRAGEHERGVGGTACKVRDGCDFAAGADDVDHRAVAALPMRLISALMTWI